MRYIDLADTNYARSIFNTIREASKATKKDPTAPGSIIYTINYQTMEATGSFSFPLEQTEDSATGGINIEIADFLQNPSVEAP